ncbi:GNAT family N-acetyltransferase [Pseudopedobacter beijingensis]|uniref:GNAT family N-acetyltransferase n=1 Tax=Pseudopedobacter beijingensis TaxID=1207056 RepID=A0ABW4I8R4_9SPHI
MTIKILTKKDLNEVVSKRISSLFRQLSTSKKQQELSALLDQNNLTIAAYIEDTEILGIASLGSYKTISGYKGWIEDVVVDENARGKGIGRKLIEKLLEVGNQQGLTEILLFTEEHRQAAIHLYESLGFTQKNSMIYNHKLAV